MLKNSTPSQTRKKSLPSQPVLTPGGVSGRRGTAQGNPTATASSTPILPIAYPLPRISQPGGSEPSAWLELEQTVYYIGRKES